MKMSDLPTDALPAIARAAADAWSPAASSTVPLSALDVGDFATIHAILPTHEDADRDLVLRLVEIGFVPGERVRIVAVARPGRQPIAVRLEAVDSGRGGANGATFALRRHEADFVRVVPDAAR